MRKLAMMLIGGLCACAEPASHGTVVEPAVEAGLTGSTWTWRYVTAALGGDRTHWLEFQPDGRVRYTERRWEYDHEDQESSYPQTTVDGQWEVSGHEVSLTLPDSSRRFTAAVLDDAPALRWEDGQPKARTVGRAFTEWAWVRDPGGYRLLWRSVEGDQVDHREARLQVDAALTAATGQPQACQISLQVLSGGGWADVSYPCRYWRTDAAPWVLIIAEELRTYDARADLLPEGEAGAVGIIPWALFVDPANPDVLVTGFADYDGTWWAATDDDPAASR